MVNTATGLAGQADRHEVVHLHSRSRGRLDGVLVHDRPAAEHTVHSQSPSFMSGHALGHFIGGVAVNVPMAPSVLAGGIVRQFGLVKIDAASVAVPEGLIFLAM